MSPGFDQVHSPASPIARPSEVIITPPISIWSGGERQHVELRVHVADVYRGRRPHEHRDQDQQLHAEMAGRQVAARPDDERRAGEADHEPDQRAPIERMRAPPARREQRDPQCRRRVEDRGLIDATCCIAQLVQALGINTLPIATMNRCRHSVASSSNCVRARAPSARAGCQRR